MGWPEDEIYKRRDEVFAEIHADVKYLREKIDDQKLALATHEAKDERLQGWILKIGVAVLIIVAANGGIPALKALFHVG